MAVRANIRFNNDIKYRDDWHPNQVALTPEYILNPVRAALGGTIGLDPCTEPDNPCKANNFYINHGCEQSWCEYSVFCNPPYSQAKDIWVYKCIEHGGVNGYTVILLIPAHTDTRIFQQAANSSHWICLISSRIRFGIKRANGRQMAASHPSCLIGWNCPSVIGLGVIVKSSITIEYDSPISYSEIGNTDL